jgi:hypothetical protein
MKVKCIMLALLALLRGLYADCPSADVALRGSVSLLFSSSSSMPTEKLSSKSAGMTSCENSSVA